MHIKVLLLFVAAVFADDIADANRIDRSRDDIDDIGPAFPFDAFGIGYEDFISKIHPPLMAAMNYRPVMPHDISRYVSDTQVASIALSSKSVVVDEPNEEATKSESFASATLEALRSPFEEPGSVSNSPAAQESASSNGESSAKTDQESVGAEAIEESTEEVNAETEDDSEKNLEDKIPESKKLEVASILSKDSIFASDTEHQSTETEGSSFSEERLLANSRDTSKDSAEKEFTDESADKTFVHESERSELKESISSKTERSREFQQVSSKASEIRKSGENPNSSSDDDYYYYTIDYIYDEREISESSAGPIKSTSDDLLMTSSYEYSDTTSTPEYYSSETIQSDEKVFIFPESHQIKDTSATKEEKEKNGSFKERESESMISKPASPESESQTPSSVSKPTQVSSESALTESESENSSRSSVKRKQSESDSGNISFSANGEAAASMSFTMSSKSSEPSREILKKPQVMETDILLKDAIEVHGHKLDFESMRKIIEHSYTELSTLRKKVTKKQNVLTDLNLVIDELQKLCQAICVTIPEKYLMTDSDPKSRMVTSKISSK